MSGLGVLPLEDPGLLLEALRRAQGGVLLLGPGQEPKPGAEPRLEALAGRENALAWVRADPHPDLCLDAFGRWLLASGLPPFAPGTSPALASAWGLLGPARVLALALEQGLARTPEGGDWQAAFLAALPGGPLVPASEAWLFQKSLPSLDEALEARARRGTAWARLGRLGPLPACVTAPALAGESAPDWLGAAESLARVPLGALAGVQISGLSAAELVGGLARAAMDRVFELAFTRGWREGEAPPDPPAVARALKRVAVLHPAYGGSLNLARRCAEALERLGYEVQRVDPSRHEQAVAEAQKLGDPARWRELDRTLEQECLAALASGRAQWLWVLAQAPLSPGALRSLRRRGLFTAFWFCEDHRVRPAWRQVAPAVDAFFPMQSGDFVPALRSLGVPALPALRGCAASDACGLPSLPAERPLTFFGAPYANRVRLFEALGDLPLELFGEGWDERATAALRPLVRDASRLSEAQGFDLFRRSALNLNLHSSPFTHGLDPEGDYLNPRTFEIAACGGFQLCDRRRDLSASFEEGRDIEAFSSVAELREKIARWSRDPEGRARVAAAARARILAEHTYEHRMMEATKTVGIHP